jgi:hypothetical protein
MPRIVYVIDTSWLLEFYEVPNHCTKIRLEKVKEKFKIAVKNKSTFILPLAVIFEYCNHIAQINTGNLRKKYATDFWSHMQMSRKDTVPYLILPAADLPEIDVDVERFAATYAIQGIGLVDIQVERIAKEWAEKPGYIVHIWSFYGLLKALEPNIEPNPID